MGEKKKKNSKSMSSKNLFSPEKYANKYTKRQNIFFLANSLIRKLSISIDIAPVQPNLIQFNPIQLRNRPNPGGSTLGPAPPYIKN